MNKLWDEDFVTGYLGIFVLSGRAEIFEVGGFELLMVMCSYSLQNLTFG
ncbi:MAG: hypothetical protein AB7O73_00850 [Bacteroidia bacterium]